MTPSIAGMLFATISFIVTFIVARTLAKWLKKRRSVRDGQKAVASQSRQVRRASERSKARR